MKNLAHLSLDSLDLLPAQSSMRWEPHNVLKPTRKVYRIYRYSYSVKKHILNQKISNVIKGSVGKNWDDVYSKLKSYTIGLKFDYDLQWILRSEISIPIWSYKFQRWEISNARSFGCYNIELEEYIRRWRLKIKRWHGSFYYVCPISNIIRKVQAQSEGVPKGTDHWRRHYAFLTQRKLTKKQRYKDNTEHLLRMINNPELFQFYVSIVGKYRRVIRQIEERDQYEQIKGSEKDINKCLRYWTPSPSKSDLNNLESWKLQIEELEKGNFNCFFESAVYLYAQQKECHHFEQP